MPSVCPAAVFQKALENHQQERRRFAGARLCLAGDVIAFERGWKRQRLDRGAVGKTNPGQPTLD